MIPLLWQHTAPVLRWECETFVYHLFNILRRCFFFFFLEQRQHKIQRLIVSPLSLQDNGFVTDCDPYIINRTQKLREERLADMDERWVGGMEEENLESIPVFLSQREPDREAGWRTGCYQLSWFWGLHNYFVNIKTKLCDSCSRRRLSDLLKAKKGQHLPVWWNMLK